MGGLLLAPCSVPSPIILLHHSLLTCSGVKKFCSEHTLFHNSYDTKASLPYIFLPKVALSSGAAL